MSNLQIKTNSKWLPIIQLFFILLWSSGAIVIVIGLHYTNPFTFLFYRLSATTIFMLLISLLFKAPWPENWNTLWKTASTGLLIQFGYVTAYFCALYYGVSPTVMTIILALHPILTAVIFNAILKQKIAKYQYLGLGIGLLGVLLTVLHDFTTHTMGIIGLIFALLCVSSITIGSVIQKNNSDMDLRTGSVIQSGISLIPLCILNWLFGSFKLPLAREFIMSLIWMSLVVSVGATCLYYKLIKDGSAVAVNSLLYLVPAITAGLCYFIFGTALNIYILSGVLLTLIGVFIVQKNS